MLNFIRKHYWENIGVEEVAKSVGYSPRRCNLLFKTCCGETIGSYLRTLRMEEARRLLDGKTPIDRVALSLSYTPRGFRKAFQEYFGISPSRYIIGEQTYEPHSAIYEYVSEGNWGMGANPTPDGLWEFSCYDPATKEYILMEWLEPQRMFQSPYGSLRTSPQWYCRNRDGGFGLHPGRATEAVKTFICPRDGTVNVFFSVGRINGFCSVYSSSWHSWYTPCAARLYLNGEPLGDGVEMSTVDPAFLTATCTVRVGDKISLHIDPMGNHRCDGCSFYVQRVSYRNPAVNLNE